MDQATADQLEKQLTSQPVIQSDLQESLTSADLDTLLAPGASAEIADKIVEAVTNHDH